MILVLDVRSPGEFGSGHIKGARNQDHETVTEIAEELKTLDYRLCSLQNGGPCKNGFRGFRKCWADQCSMCWQWRDGTLG